MNALRVLTSPKVWVSIVAVVMVLSLLFYAYLTAIASPTENLKDLPVALVNEDEGGELGGEEVALGDQVVERVTGSDSPADGVVEWTQPNSRMDALEGLGRNEFYGAIVIPKDYTERISTAASPPELPLAIVNEDEGAEMQGEPTRLGEEVVKRITGPDSPAPSFVQWKQLDSRQAALDGISKGEAYAAIVIPKDYSKTLASMSGPPPGAQGAPQQGEMSVPPPDAASGPPPGAEMPEPEPANLELLSSPAVRPATAGAVENAFNGIVGGVSGATSERILGGLAEGGGPVRANVTEAEPVGDNSGNGQSPFFLAFLANLAGFGGAAVVFFGVARVADSLASRGMRPSRVGFGR